MTSRSSDTAANQVREYGGPGPLVVVLHGGPGAPGYMAPVARRLADSFTVLEPLQRGSGDEPLTVRRHVEDLNDLVESRCGAAAIALVGHSWGAMLALAYAAEHPSRSVSLVLISCGTFDAASRDRLRTIREERTDNALRRRLRNLLEEVHDPDERLRVSANLTLPLDSYDPAVDDMGVSWCDARAHDETWEDMLRLQEQGVYPARFSAIRAPVLMLHGVVDPHPGRMILASLKPHLPQIEYREWERCGHYPWLEKAVRDDFFAVLGEWLVREFKAAGAR